MTLPTDIDADWRPQVEFAAQEKVCTLLNGHAWSPVLLASLDGRECHEIRCANCGHKIMWPVAGR